MSGVLPVELDLKPVNALGQMQAWQAVRNAQAQQGAIQAGVGLTRARTVGEQIRNALSGIGLDYQRYRLGAAAQALAGAGVQPIGAQPPAPQQGADGHAYTVPSGGTPPGGGAPAGAASFSTSAGTASFGAPAVNALSAPAAAPQYGAGNGNPFAHLPANGTGPGGLNLGIVGAPLPTQQAIGALQNPDYDLKALQDRRTAIYQAAAGAHDTASWNQELTTLRDRGYITNGDAAAMWGRFDLRRAVMDKYASPDETMRAQSEAVGRGLTMTPTGGYTPYAPAVAGPAAVEGAKAAAKGHYETTSVTVPTGETDANGQPLYRTETVQTSELPTFMQAHDGARQTSAADYANPSITIGTNAMLNRIVAHESGGNYGATNHSGPGGAPTSAAGGGLQFEPGTWVGLVKQYAPQIAQGRTDQQIAALRFDASPQGVALQRQMGAHYLAQNAAALKAEGMPVNAMTLGMAHEWGAAGATTILRASPQTKIAPALVGKAAFQANPAWQGKTVAQVTANAYGAYGVNRYVVPGTAEQNAAPAGVGAGAEASAPAAPGAIPGPPVLSPQQQKQLDVQTQVAESERGPRAAAYGDVSKQIIEAGADYQQKLERLDVLQNAASDFRPGASAEVRSSAMRKLVDALQTVGMKVPPWMMKGAMGSEVMKKEGGYLAAEMTRALGSREAASVFEAVRGIQPNMTLSTGGYQAVIDSIKEGVMRDRDLLNFQEKWLGNPGHGHSIKGMIEAFNKAYPVQAYASRVLPYPLKAGMKPSQLVPNTIYRNAAGNVALWNGRAFVTAPAAGQ